jgi:hypothetical protein
LAATSFLSLLKGGSTEGGSVEAPAFFVTAEYAAAAELLCIKEGQQNFQEE